MNDLNLAEEYVLKVMKSITGINVEFNHILNIMSEEDWMKEFRVLIDQKLFLYALILFCHKFQQY